jgi:hypothetical protein
MIENYKQYEITQEKMEGFLDALDKVEQQTGIDPILKQIQLDALESQIQVFEGEIEDYEKLHKKGEWDDIFIKSPEELEAAIKLAIETKDVSPFQYEKVVYALYKYKWYNWYQNTRFKEGSEADIKHTELFEKLEAEQPEIHAEIEQFIDWAIERLNSDIDD